MSYKLCLSNARRTSAEVLLTAASLSAHASEPSRIAPFDI